MGEELFHLGPGLGSITTRALQDYAEGLREHSKRLGRTSTGEDQVKLSGVLREVGRRSDGFNGLRRLAC